LKEVLIGSFTMAVKLFSVILLALYGSYLPRRINLLFAATIACFGFVPFARLGYLQAAFVNVSPDVISQITSVSIALGICVLLFFLRLFLTPFAPHRLTLVLANVLIVISSMGLPALWFDMQQLATMIATASFTLVAPVTGLMLVTCVFIWQLIDHQVPMLLCFTNYCLLPIQPFSKIEDIKRWNVSIQQQLFR
jgi:hypothetical protein